MSKQINLPQTNREPSPRKRSSPGDWLVALAGYLTFMATFAIILGGFLWIALKIWGSVLSMM